MTPTPQSVIDYVSRAAAVAAERWVDLEIEFVDDSVYLTFSTFKDMVLKKEEMDVDISYIEGLKDPGAAGETVARCEIDVLEGGEERP